MNHMISLMERLQDCLGNIDEYIQRKKNRALSPHVILMARVHILKHLAHKAA